MIARINDGFYDFSVKNSSAYTDLDDEDFNDPDVLEKMYQKYSDEYKVNPELLKLYPIKNDPEFWKMVFKRDKALNNNSRIMKTDMIKRIQIRNNNKNDKYLGLGYTLNFMDIERDYVFQYYLFGILGIILFILPYMVLLIYSGINLLFHFNNNLKFRTFLTFMSPAMGLIVAYLSGHVFGWVSPMLFLVMSLGMLRTTITYNIETGGVKK